MERRGGGGGGGKLELGFAAVVLQNEGTRSQDANPLTTGKTRFGALLG